MQVSELLEPPRCFVGVLLEGVKEIVTRPPQASSGEFGHNITDAGVIPALVRRGEKYQQPGRIDDRLVRRIKGRLDKGLPLSQWCEIWSAGVKSYLFDNQATEAVADKNERSLQRSLYCVRHAQTNTQRSQRTTTRLPLQHKPLEKHLRVVVELDGRGSYCWAGVVLKQHHPAGFWQAGREEVP